MTSKQSTRGNGSDRGKGFSRGKGKFVITCYRCGVEGHKSSKCPERQGPNKRGGARTQVTIAGDATVVREYLVVLPLEQGEKLMFQRILLKPEQKSIGESE